MDQKFWDSIELGKTKLKTVTWPNFSWLIVEWIGSCDVAGVTNINSRHVYDKDLDWKLYDEPIPEINWDAPGFWANTTFWETERKTALWFDKITKNKYDVYMFNHNIVTVHTITVNQAKREESTPCARPDDWPWYPEGS